jgi:excisionase family DNA binding protein
VSGPYLTTDEAAAMLHISRWQLFTLIKSRELPSFKPGRRRLIPLAAIEAYADLRTFRSQICLGYEILVSETNIPALQEAMGRAGVEGAPQIEIFTDA